MCGITGFFQHPEFFPHCDSHGSIHAMANTLRHRGPDGAGVWTDGLNIALAHRRLSIVDLSSAGCQPMVSEDGRYILIFNGEIYNSSALRNQLTSFSWRGHSDTEVLLATFQTLGIEETLKRTVGMFALAIWDRDSLTLTLARDRFGEKPLYYGWQGNSFLFGSELKSLASHPSWQAHMNRHAISLFVQYGYVPAPHSVWTGIFKLPPGTFITLRSDSPVSFLPSPIFYWRALDAINVGTRDDSNDARAISELDKLLSKAIAGQMAADVPLGALLSGGIDSSLVASFMQSQSIRPINTFTIGFGDSDYNEAYYAKAVATHLGTHHTDLYVSTSDALDIIPRLPDMYDEPFGDVSQIPTYLLARMASNTVKVCLTGDGADELFGGYKRYLLGPSLWHFIHMMPLNLRRPLARLIEKVSTSNVYHTSTFSYNHVSHRLSFNNILGKLSSFLNIATIDDLYCMLVSFDRHPEATLINSIASDYGYESWSIHEMTHLGFSNPSQRMMFNDLLGYLTDDILCKVDRAAMFASIETRIPFLDPHIVDFAFQLPPNMKIRGGIGKWILRQLLYRYVPRSLVDRPKQGFGVPINSWLRGPLREWADTLLDEHRLRREGVFQTHMIRQNWNHFLAGSNDRQYWLWNILMYQAWQEKWA